VKTRYLADESICSSDLCIAAGKRLLELVGWEPGSVDALIFVTQSPDYLLPSTCCVAHKGLGLKDSCAAFDVGLGCSGYPYGLWLAASMLSNPGIKRVLLLHGETPTRFSDKGDRAVALLFGDAGSATAIETREGETDQKWWFAMHTDGSGLRDLMIEGGGFRSRFPTEERKNYVNMNGANVFNFTIKRVPAMIEDTLKAAGIASDAVDYFIFHQSNQFIMRHLAKKAQLPETKIPMVIGRFGSAGGPSVPLTMTQGGLNRSSDRGLKLLLLGYGVGLSWGSALINLEPDAKLDHLFL
jgi:3-oxoacyl-[acyl-carrier-protein] synthase-3